MQQCTHQQKHNDTIAYINIGIVSKVHNKHLINLPKVV